MSNPTGLIPISGCDDANRIGDVIFVHGLGGDARETWHPEKKRDDDNFWPMWLGEELSDVGIWSLGYDVEPFKWKGNTMPLVDRATNTLAVLDSHTIGDRPLIFIAHSLGGLLVKQMLRHACDYGTPEWKLIVEQTKGIVFLSTPHSGSNMANWVKYIGVILQASVSVDELEAHHSRLRELNEVYRNHEWLSQIPIQVYCEKQKTYGFLVVDETSANPGIKGVTPIPMDDDHLSICRPSSQENMLYRRVSKFIKNKLASSHPIQFEPKQKSVEESKLLVRNKPESMVELEIQKSLITVDKSQVLKDVEQSQAKLYQLDQYLRPHISSTLKEVLDWLSTSQSNLAKRIVTKALEDCPNLKQVVKRNSSLEKVLNWEFGKYLQFIHNSLYTQDRTLLDQPTISPFLTEEGRLFTFEERTTFKTEEEKFYTLAFQNLKDAIPKRYSEDIKVEMIDYIDNLRENLPK